VSSESAAEAATALYAALGPLYNIPPVTVVATEHAEVGDNSPFTTIRSMLPICHTLILVVGSSTQNEGAAMMLLVKAAAALASCQLVAVHVDSKTDEAVGKPGSATDSNHTAKQTARVEVLACVSRLSSTAMQRANMRQVPRTESKPCSLDNVTVRLVHLLGLPDAALAMLAPGTLSQLKRVVSDETGHKQPLHAGESQSSAGHAAQSIDLWALNGAAVQMLDLGSCRHDTAVHVHGRAEQQAMSQHCAAACSFLPETVTELLLHLISQNRTATVIRTPQGMTEEQAIQLAQCFTLSTCSGVDTIELGEHSVSIGGLLGHRNTKVASGTGPLTEGGEQLLLQGGNLTPCSAAFLTELLQHVAERHVLKAIDVEGPQLALLDSRQAHLLATALAALPHVSIQGLSTPPVTVTDGKLCLAWDTDRRSISDSTLGRVGAAAIAHAIRNLPSESAGRACANAAQPTSGEVMLSGAELGPEGTVVVLSALSQSCFTSQVSSMQVASVDLGQSGCSALSTFLLAMSPAQLLQLDLRSNHLNARCMTSMLAGLAACSGAVRQPCHLWAYLFWACGPQCPSHCSS
jgi:hypothetical protein